MLVNIVNKGLNNCGGLNPIKEDPDNDDDNDSDDLRRSGISGLSFGDLPELSRAEEKEAMKNNNNKLANYIDNVRRLQKVKIMMMIKMMLIIMTMILKMMTIMMMMIKMMIIKVMLIIMTMIMEMMIIMMMIMKENGRMIRQIEVIETSQTKEINDLKHIYDREIEDLKVMKIIMMR